MPLTWTFQPAAPNFVQRWTAADGELTAEVAETMPGGRWLVTVRRGGTIVGTHRMTDTAEEGKRVAEGLAGGK
jgi:hypothetical protein